MIGNANACMTEKESVYDGYAEKRTGQDNIESKLNDSWLRPRGFSFISIDKKKIFIYDVPQHEFVFHFNFVFFSR